MPGKSERTILQALQWHNIGTNFQMQVFYTRPTYAIMDEATSAISVDFVQTIYSMCDSLGITMLTVAHDDSLLNLHAVE